jgi:excisionase family DNA binding protein
MFADLPQFLTVEEFRTVVGLGRSTVYDLLRRGAIPHRRFGRVVRIPKSALRPYCDLADDGMESRDDQTEQSP